MNITDRSWLGDAACRQAVPEVFFPERHNSSAYMAAALSYCRSCDVADECLQDALAEEAGRSRRLIFGVRGGHGPTARYRMQESPAKEDH